MQLTSRLEVFDYDIASHSQPLHNSVIGYEIETTKP